MFMASIFILVIIDWWFVYAFQERDATRKNDRRRRNHTEMMPDEESIGNSPLLLPAIFFRRAKIHCAIF